MRQHTIAVLQALFVVFLWATSWVFVKIGLHELPPITFAGLRYFLAFICLLAVLFFTGSQGELRELSRGTWIKFITLGILFYAGTQGASFVALAYLPAVTVNMLWGFSSVVIALSGIALLSERPGFFQWAGMLLAVLGAVIYFYPIEIAQNQAIGFTVAIVGVLANAASAILGRHVNQAGKHNPLVVTVISMGVGSLILLLTGLSLEAIPTLDLQSWMIIIWLALVNTAFAFTLWNHTLRTLTALESSVINGTITVWIALFAVLFLGETITGQEAAGLLATGVGSMIVQLQGSSSTEQT